jgi:hypothetical protein|tara:strand:- start:2695 stop:2808 length:114 start_codon:yes stop_codon:yes gene_type:complete
MRMSYRRVKYRQKKKAHNRLERRRIAREIIRARRKKK